MQQSQPTGDSSSSRQHHAATQGEVIYKGAAAADVENQTKGFTPGQSTTHVESVDQNDQGPQLTFGDDPVDPN